MPPPDLLGKWSNMVKASSPPYHFTFTTSQFRGFAMGILSTNQLHGFTPASRADSGIQQKKPQTRRGGHQDFCPALGSTVWTPAPLAAVCSWAKSRQDYRSYYHRRWRSNAVSYIKVPWKVGSVLSLLWKWNCQSTPGNLSPPGCLGHWTQTVKEKLQCPFLCYPAFLRPKS